MQPMPKTTYKTEVRFLAPGSSSSWRPADERAAPRFSVRRVLMVCVGNVCRSPIAEFVMRERLADPEIIVESAGIAAVPGDRIDPRALNVLERHGIDADSHVARRLDKAMLDRADLVLTMERRHMEFIRAFSLASTGKTFLLGRWQGGFEIPDPFGKPQESFDHVYRMVDLAIHRWRALM